MTWTPPNIDLPRSGRTDAPNGALADQLKRALREIGVKATISRVIDGPRTVTFELQPEPGVAMRDFTRLRRLDDLAYALEAETVDIQAPIPGRKVVGLTIPNPAPRTVELGDIAPARPPLAFGVGIGPDNRPVSLDMANLPHLAVAGASGSGKSSLLHTILCNLLLRETPDDLRLLLIDLKRVELGQYRGLPHLLEPTITNSARAVEALEELGDEVERRYGILEEAGALNLASYNHATGYTLPRILCVVDELGDLMLQAHKRVEAAIMRLGQLGRACGVHVIVATQSPHAQILSGLIKANMPGRVALRVASGVHSRVAIDQTGAEKLLGQGDALLQDGRSPVLQRFQSAHVPESVIAGIVGHWQVETTLSEAQSGNGVPEVPARLAEPVSAPEAQPRTPMRTVPRVSFTPTTVSGTDFVGRIAL